MLDHLATRRSGRTRRESSWDRTGRNSDRVPVEPGATHVLADLRGAGVIRHLWITISHNEAAWPRRLLLKMYWDGQEEPSVLAPVGDFFGVGHGVCNSFQCAVLNQSSNANPGPNAAMNCYFPMPFAHGARIEIENQGETATDSLYFYVDYDELPELPADQLRFHACWNRSNPCPPPSDYDDPTDHAVNLSDRHNYLFMEAEGSGHYVGVNLSIHNLYGGWWGEGDDMFMIDGQKWPPDLHGTGSEDYFCHAWGMQPGNSFLYNGVSFQKGTPFTYNERTTVYRYHVVDPVIFHDSLRVSIEHGHANDRCDDYSSTAYWYQTPRHRPLSILPVAERLPRPDVVVQPVNLPIPPLGRRTSGSPIDPQFLRE
ncbi:MAG: DUF2961 domain-containing protein [Armatimonadetes bacterium]|nr:DUF2961 domain-containing protein [Armatimonadota bacterium]